MDSAHPGAPGELEPLLSPADRRDPTLRLRSCLRADDLIGRSPPMVELLRQLSQLAPLDVSVLLTGPSGTGKTHIARVIHASSPRAAAGKFVELSCANLPDSLVENELFGAAPGAHSTAIKAVEGKVFAAHGGTLLFDEIAELSLPAQAKLLQLLQSREYYPLGASRPRAADVRVIAATNCDLKARVARREFREDLYYRLHVVPIRVPSLTERRDDIPELAQHFCVRACVRHRLPPLHLSQWTLVSAQAACWPGNIRELANAVEAAVIRAAGEDSREVETRHLFPAREHDHESAGPLNYREALRCFQTQLVRGTLVDSNWNVAEAARRLAVTRAHMYNLMQTLDISRP
ncbi:sigma 54-interacting transcriptional regulator [Nannocystis bainbridge]|uniref:Sigma-54 dependent transcriptional regulator n=1 Tax=Nannocystis bainbridge TaxID=2995303 RepID=A0ABT5E8J9_9BACT|nr:sigma-54 dependent transcriptional regulator [Nannocystis bainbridge]MDC0722200.1 sigma-54 dependent transcriptional regulator [Nannocystis bainbridge]